MGEVLILTECDVVMVLRAEAEAEAVKLGDSPSDDILRTTSSSY